MVMASTKSSPRQLQTSSSSAGSGSSTEPFGYFNFGGDASTSSAHNNHHHHNHQLQHSSSHRILGTGPGLSGNNINNTSKNNSQMYQPYIPEVKITLAGDEDNAINKNKNNLQPMSSHSASSSIELKTPTSPIAGSSFNLPFKLSTNVNPKNFDIKDLEDISEINTLSEFKDLRDDETSDLLVIDTRPFNQYSTSRLKDALSICVPSTLLKRSSFHLSNIFKTMTSQQQQAIDLKLKGSKDLNIVFYDSNSSSEQCSFHLYQILKKFQSDAKQYGKTIDLYLLNKGFTSFLHQEGISDEDSIFDFKKIKSTNSGDSFADFILPSANPTSSFLMSMKKNHALPEEENGVHPSNIHVPNLENPERLPTWLQPYLAPNSVNMIIKNFVRIENAENARITSVVSQKSHSPSICSPSCLCPCCDQLNYNILDGSEHGYKNRYPNILPYEHSRVRLIESPLLSPIMSSNNNSPNKYFPKVSPSASSQNKLHLTATTNSAVAVTGTSPQLSHLRPHDDYFNANFINVPQINKEARYIATQAPLPSTIDDFWKVVWHNNSEIIVSLTDLNEYGIKKSDVYWQNTKKVQLLDEHEDYNGLKNLTVRKIQLTRKSQSRIITQLHFKDWPDHGVADYSSLLKLTEIKDEFTTKKSAPVVVHCSAGCGRTGVFITVDLITNAFKSKTNTHLIKGNVNLLKKHSLDDDGNETGEEIDIWNTQNDLIYFTVQQLRKQRISMVQSLNQFIFCYETVLEFFNNLEQKQYHYI